MGTIDRIFDIFRGVNPFRASQRPLQLGPAVARTGQAPASSAPVLQTPDERAAVRQRMEAELGEQRERRVHAGSRP
jgi:hypothetical protein